MLGYPKWIDEMAADEHFIVKKFDIIKDNMRTLRRPKVPIT